MKSKIYLLNFSNYPNKKYSKFTSNFVYDRDSPNFHEGQDKGGTEQKVLRFQ